jgi:hypothetical protein
MANLGLQTVIISTMQLQKKINASRKYNGILTIHHKVFPNLST